MISLDGKRKFLFERPNDDINKVLKEFLGELQEALKKQAELSKPLLLKSLFDLITLSEEPTKNYQKIEEAKLSFNLFNYYFHFDPQRVTKTNELIEAIPRLFESPEYYFTFLRGIKFQVTLLFQQAKSETIFKLREKKFKPYTIAYAIWFFRNGNGSTEKIEDTVKTFLSNFDGNQGTVVKYISTVQKFTSTDHQLRSGQIKEALKLLGNYPKGRAGIDWWAANKTRYLGG